MIDKRLPIGHRVEAVNMRNPAMNGVTGQILRFKDGNSSYDGADLVVIEFRGWTTRGHHLSRVNPVPHA